MFLTKNMYLESRNGKFRRV